MALNQSGHAQDVNFGNPATWQRQARRLCGPASRRVCLFRRRRPRTHATFNLRHHRLRRLPGGMAMKYLPGEAKGQMSEPCVGMRKDGAEPPRTETGGPPPGDAPQRRPIARRESFAQPLRDSARRSASAALDHSLRCGQRASHGPFGSGSRPGDSWPRTPRPSRNMCPDVALKREPPADGRHAGGGQDLRARAFLTRTAMLPDLRLGSRWTGDDIGSVQQRESSTRRRRHHGGRSARAGPRSEQRTR